MDKHEQRARERLASTGAELPRHESQVNKKEGALLAYGLWVNYQSKFLEYLDTAFMVARKKFDQVRAQSAFEAT